MIKYRKWGEDMDIRVLRYFVAVAEEENITNAARKLHMTQPSLSRQMMELEKELGKSLFIRTNKKTLLTEEGMHLKRRAEEILSLVEKTTAELLTTSEEIYGHICFGAGETDIMRYFANAIKRIHDRHPRVRFTLFSGNAEDILEKLENGVLDFGLIFSSNISEKYNRMPIPLSDLRGILMRKDSPWAKFDRITREELKQMPLITSSRSAYTEAFLSQWFRGSAETLNIVASYNLIFNAVFLVEAGVGNAICLNDLVDTPEESPLCFRPLDPPSRAELTLVWKRGRALSQAGELFLEEVKREFERLPSADGIGQ